MVLKKQSKKLRIGVLMGGKSIEREVSLNSGRTICDHLDTTRYDIIPIFQRVDGSLYILPWHFLHRGKIVDFESRLLQEAQAIVWDQLRELIDFAYFAMHGRHNEDGCLQGFLAVLGIPYLGSKVLASSLGMDKTMQRMMLAAKGILVPKGVSISPRELWRNKNMVTIIELLQQKMKQEEITFPVIVKPVGEGSSLGVSVVFNKKNLLAAVMHASEIDQQRRQAIIIEEKIEGMEFTCIHLQKMKLKPTTLDGVAAASLFQAGQDSDEDDWLPLPITEVVPEKNSYLYDYEQKYMPGRATKVTPPRCLQEAQRRIEQTCLCVLKTLGFSTISRIDGFLTKSGEIIIIDANSLSGFGPAYFVFHQAAEIGINHTQLINYLIEAELERYRLSGWKFTHGRMQVKQKEPVQQKIRVAVLIGGSSNEREISLESGRNVCYKLSPQKYETIPLFVNDKLELFQLTQRLLLQNSTREIDQQLKQTSTVSWADLPQLCDFVFIALHGGSGENGSVQGTLEMLGMPYNGSGVLASALCMDKYKTNMLLESIGFDVPMAKILSRNVWEEAKEVSKVTSVLDEFLNGFSFPLIIKPTDDGCSFFVKKVVKKQELPEAIDAYFISGKQEVMLEECITGMELSCGVMGNDFIEVFPPSMPLAKNSILSIQEKFLPGEGENQTPAPLPKTTLDFVRKIISKVYKVLGCRGYARIDCFYQNAKISPTGKQRLVLLEVNTLPGLTPATCIFHQAAEVGLRPMDFIDRIVSLGFEVLKYQRRNFQSVAVQPARKKRVMAANVS